MRCIIDTTIDPYWNLAAEEILLKESNEPIFRLWQNDNAVIVGKYQNTPAEIEVEYVKKHKINVVRRLTGGGAVYHDLGNVNFTFIDKNRDNQDSAEMFRHFTLPIIDILDSLGVKAYLEGRNDLLIDGMKFSGNALCIYKERILQHGTLLFSSSMRDISGALTSRPEKYSGRAVKSNPRRVTNISDHLPHKMSISEFIDYIKEYILTQKGGYRLSDYTTEEKRMIDELADNKYRTYQWNWGSSPNCQINLTKKFPSGLIELKIDIEKGAIGRVKIFGDYFFLKPTEEIEERLTGIKYDPEAIREALNGMNMNDYFGSLTIDDFIELCFG